MNAPGGGARVARLRRIGLTLTLLGLFAATPIAISWLAGRDLPSSPPEGLAIVSAAAFAAASILFLATGRSVGALVALPAITTGALLDDPETMAMMLLFTAPIAEMAGVIAAQGFPAPVAATWRASFAEIRATTGRALASGPVRMPAAGPWVLDRLAVGAASVACVAFLAWGLLVVAFGSGDDPLTRTVIPSATEFPLVLGVGLAAAVTSAVLCFLTGRVPGVVMTLPVVPAIWLDAPQRSEVVVLVVTAAFGLVVVLASPIPSSGTTPDPR